MNRVVPEACRTDEGNLNSPAEGTLHMVIFTCFPQMPSEENNNDIKNRTDFMASTNKYL